MKLLVAALLVVLFVASASAKVSIRLEDPPISCVLCMNVVQYLESVVKVNDTVSRLMGIVDKTCSKFHVEDWCVANIEPKLAAILPKLESKVNPNVVCQSIQLCTANVTFLAIEEVEVEEEEKEDSAKLDVKCELCTAIVSYAKNAVGSQPTQDSIKKALDTACAKIPFAKNLCSTVLEPFLTNIINGIINKQDPATICTKIHLCN